jgi:hypothetical protein
MEVAMPKALRIPSYRHHKPTGQAVVTLNDRNLYLGKWDSKPSKAEYNRLVGEWLATRTCIMKPQFKEEIQKWLAKQTRR